MLVVILVRVAALVGMLLMCHYLGVILPSNRRIAHSPDATPANDTAIQPGEAADFMNSHVSTVLAMMDLDLFRTAADALRDAANALIPVEPLEDKLSPAALLIIFPVFIKQSTVRFLDSAWIKILTEDRTFHHGIRPLG
ncbi:hypothetical protein IscW_ISCW009939 [Ixodes scapularis]|uniref:Uncharacterized protein n=1 Tax=Ixodes scapularis TaxID=6945 RepID=B7Q3B6_IXOSC|nr:hypothetical protein IscW_ISCW009939 [Ixodes scapularis]|eukprot:XP_002411214.1 hypothetical protein IscW_ISCW009939 [Ixodes scapularis]